jgi:hypothetical protein
MGGVKLLYCPHCGIPISDDHEEGAEDTATYEADAG